MATFAQASAPSGSKGGVKTPPNHPCRLTPIRDRNRPTGSFIGGSNDVRCIRSNGGTGGITGGSGGTVRTSGDNRVGGFGGTRGNGRTGGFGGTHGIDSARSFGRSNGNEVTKGVVKHTPIIAHIISVCGFPEDAAMVQYINQEGWERLEDVTTIDVNEVKDFYTVHADGFTFEASPVIYLQRFTSKDSSMHVDSLPTLFLSDMS